MSRFITLEEYLEGFVDENTRSAKDDVALMVTDEQAQTLGFFLLNGLAGFVESVRLERASRHSEEEGGLELRVIDEPNDEGFIN